MTTLQECIPIEITPMMYDRANKMERAFFDKKGKDMGIKVENHDYFIGILGELALREYLKFNNIPHKVDDVLRSDFGDDFDVMIGSYKIDAKTQKMSKLIPLEKLWDKMDFRLFPKQLEKLEKKHIDFAYRCLVSADYSMVFLIGFIRTEDIGRFAEKEDMGENYKVPFCDLYAPWRAMQFFYEGVLD